MSTVVDWLIIFQQLVVWSWHRSNTHSTFTSSSFDCISMVVILVLHVLVVAWSLWAEGGLVTHFATVVTDDHSSAWFLHRVIGHWQVKLRTEIRRQTCNQYYLIKKNFQISFQNHIEIEDTAKLMLSN